MNTNKTLGVKNSTGNIKSMFNTLFVLKDRLMLMEEGYVSFSHLVYSFIPSLTIIHVKWNHYRRTISDLKDKVYELEYRCILLHSLHVNHTYNELVSKN